MTIAELVELSGIRETENFREIDFAVPIDKERGTYPHDGKAISVCYNGRGMCFDIVSYLELAKMALSKMMGNDTINVKASEIIHSIKMDFIDAIHDKTKAIALRKKLDRLSHICHLIERE